MKVIFLDFDGVLNGRAWIRDTQKPKADGSAPSYWNDPCDPAIVARLNTIIERTGAHIVFSTAWRIGQTLGDLKRFLHRAGFAFHRNCIGMTGRSSSGFRGNEVQKWLDENGTAEGVTGYLILDDSSDFLPTQLAHFVRTNTEIGLTDDHVAQAISLLGARRSA